MHTALTVSKYETLFIEHRYTRHNVQKQIYSKTIAGEAQNQLGVQRKTCLGRVYAFASRGGLRRGVRIGGGAQQERSRRVGAFSSPGGGCENSGGLLSLAASRQRCAGGRARVFALPGALRSGARVVREPSRWQEAAMKTATASVLRRQGVRVGRARFACLRSSAAVGRA
jgi:hypothetical protein